jgi:hypothetical protein
MAITQAGSVTPSGGAAPANAVRRTQRRDDAVFAGLAVAVTVGLFVDGWAHINLSGMESFFTPWHAFFYGAVLAAEAWLLSRLVRNARRGARGLSAIPEGYGLSVVGALLFPAAGLADFLWHAVFGIEADIAALLSPTHLLLLVTGALMFSGPLRSSWRVSASHEGARLGEILPALMGLTMAAAAVGLFLEYLSPFVNDDPFAVSWAPGTEHGAAEDQVVIGVAGVLVTTLLVVTPTLVLLRRWQLPFGSIAFLASTVALLPSAAHGFEHGAAGLVAAPVGGVVADTLIRWLRPSPQRPRGYPLVAATLPLAVWSSHFVALAAAGGLRWPPELWGGAIGLATLGGLALALLMSPMGAPPRPSAPARTPMARAGGIAIDA